MENPDAIPKQDVSENPESQTETPEAEAPEQKPLSPRQQRMAEIINSRREAEAADTSADAGAPPVTDLNEHEHEPEPEAAAPTEPEPEPEQMLKLKVNGVEQEMPISKAQALLQKNLAADQRLQQASERERVLQQRENELAALQEQLRQQQLEGQPQQPSEPEEDADTDDDLKQLISQHRQAIYDGEDDQADELMLQITKAQAGRQQPTRFDPEAIAQQTAEQVKAQLDAEAEQQRQREYEAERVSAVESFKTEFSDIADDPRLFHMTDQITVEIMQDNPDMRPSEVLAKAGETVRQWMNDKGLTQSDTMTDRQQRKQSLPRMPKPSGGAYEPPAEPKPKTPQQIIADMRAARHF